MTGASLIKEARLRTGLTQAELARRMGTTQSAVARWESGATSPRFDTVVRAVRACGLELGVSLAEPDPDHDRLIGDELARTPRERLDDLLSRLETERLLHSAPRVG